MTRRSNRLLPIPITALVAMLLALPAALAQQADWDVIARIASSADDSEEFLTASLDDPQRWPAGFSYAESSDLELGRDADHAAQIVGLRFINLQIPAGAPIDRAVIEFTADSDQSGPLTVTIRAQDAVETNPFTQDQDGQGSFDLTRRASNAATQTWSPEAWSAGQSYTSVDISGILQEHVNREGWQAGSSVVLLLRPTPAGGDGLRSAHAYDSNPQLAPRLLVSLGGGTDEGELPAEPEDGQAEEPAAEPAQDEEPVTQPAAPEVEVEPVDPDPIIPPARGEETPSVWQGPTEEDGQPTGQLEEAEPAQVQADEPVAPDEPRRQRFPLIPNFSGGLAGSVLLSDYGGGVTVVTVFLDNPDPEVTYFASIQQGACGSRGELVVDLQPIPGDQAFSTSLLSLGFDELAGGGYNATIYRTAADFVRIAACAAFGGS